jgi:hypothetical protein
VPIKVEQIFTFVELRNIESAKFRRHYGIFLAAEMHWKGYLFTSFFYGDEGNYTIAFLFNSGCLLITLQYCNAGWQRISDNTLKRMKADLGDPITPFNNAGRPKISDNSY